MTSQPKPPVAPSFTRPVVDTADGEQTVERVPWALTEKRAKVFDYIDDKGETVEVTMPDVPNPGLALEFLRKGRNLGTELAISWLIEQAIGADGYTALTEELSAMPDPENGLKLVAQIGELVQKRVLGGLEGPKA